MTTGPVLPGSADVAIVAGRLLSRKLQQDVTLQLGTLQETVGFRLSPGEPMTTACPLRSNMDLTPYVF